MTLKTQMHLFKEDHAIPLVKLLSTLTMAQAKINSISKQQWKLSYKWNHFGIALRGTVIPDGRGGNYSIGMLRSRNDDLLALSFDAKNFNFVNVGMDISSIDLPCAGGPFGIEDPIFRVSAIDSPDGVPRLTGTVLDSANMTGPVAPNEWTFLWTNKVVALNVTESTNGNVSIVWDLIQSGYAAFDNLIVAASDTPGFVPP